MEDAKYVTFQADKLNSLAIDIIGNKEFMNFMKWSECHVEASKFQFE
jgi:hypothetical protein